MIDLSKSAEIALNEALLLIGVTISKPEDLERKYRTQKWVSAAMSNSFDLAGWADQCVSTISDMNKPILRIEVVHEQEPVSHIKAFFYLAEFE